MNMVNGEIANDRLTRKDRVAFLDHYTRKQLNRFAEQTRTSDYSGAIVTLERLTEWMHHYDSDWLIR